MVEPLRNRKPSSTHGIHNHDRCLELAGDSQFTPADPDSPGDPGLAQGKARPWNILMYVRKSDDVDEILDCLQ